MRILIVDDDAGLRQSLALLLRESGYEVAAEGDPEQALARAASDPFELILCDVRMPRMSGYALVDAGIALKPDLKVLLITGFSRDPLPDHLTKRGVEILYKPFDLEMLPDLARQTMGAN